MRTVQRTALCRSRRELFIHIFRTFSSTKYIPFLSISFQIDPDANEYFLAKIGFDTAESEPCKVSRFRALGNLNVKLEISN